MKIIIAHNSSQGAMLQDIRQVLVAKGHEAILLDADNYFANSLEVLHADLVFNLAVGGTSSASQAMVPIICENQGIPYTGSEPLTLAFCQDKVSFYNWAITQKYPVPRFAAVHSVAALKPYISEFASMFPLFVKPAAGDFGQQIRERNIARAPSDLIMLVEELLDEGSRCVIVQEWVAGREVSVTFLGNPPDLCNLPLVEVDFENAEGLEVFGEETRRFYDGNRSILKKTSLGLLDKHLYEIAHAVHNGLGCRDYSRVDFRVGLDKIPYLIDVNPVPEFSAYEEAQTRSMVAAECEQIPMDALIEYLVNLALQRVKE
jgi:D-alanine-D-alanine ligase